MSRKDDTGYMEAGESPHVADGKGKKRIYMSGASPQENPVWRTIPDVQSRKRSMLEKITVNELIWKMKADDEEDDCDEPESWDFEGNDLSETAESKTDSENRRDGPE
ncbi:MAG: hypothetical protein JXR95_11465 [Deltaproteobacteria bacterium]|nr:hypothetical protein [Deltaproteobacteria bacterium]